MRKELQEQFGEFYETFLEALSELREHVKQKYPDVSNGKGIPYTGLSNARPETKAIADRVKSVVDIMPFDIEEYLEFHIPDSDSVGDWGN